MINKYIINSLLFNDDLWNLRVIGKDDDLDIISLDFNNLQYNKFTLIDLIKSDNCILAPTISIDAELLQDSDIIDVLRYKSKDSVMRIRIVNKDYVLTEEDYNKLDFVDYIYVDKVEDFNYNLFKVFLQSGIYKRQYEKISSEEDVYRDVFHVTERLNSVELRKLVMDANNCNKAEIDLNLYDPSYYSLFLNNLKDLGLNEDVDITLLSNVLVDSKNVFDGLEEFGNDINIIYSSNPEVINYYTEEPMNNMANYDNQLEINDHASLYNYINLLELIDGGAEFIRDKAYSPLESIVWTYKYIRESELDIDPSVLFSAILRRSGERVFRYSSLGSNKNILRVKDKKYNVDNIGVVDFNIDLDEYKFNEEYSNYLYFPNISSEYCNFIYSPRDLLKCFGYDETLSVSNSLVLDKETYNSLKYKSSDNFEVFYNMNYDNRGNTFRFLELTGLKDDNEEYDIDNLYNYINTINESGYTLNISDKIIFDALLNVEKSINPSISDSEIGRIEECYKRANQIRDNNIFVRDYHVVANYDILETGELIYDEREIKVTPIEAQDIILNNDVEEEKEMVSVVEDVDTQDEYISGTNIKRPRSIREGESREEYNAYYRDYFNKYLVPVINSKKNQEEEFIIDNRSEDEVVVVLDVDKYKKYYSNEAVVVSVDAYNKYKEERDEITSLPYEEFISNNDFVVVVPFDKYDDYKYHKKIQEDARIISREIFNRYFKKSDEEGIVVSREVYDKYMKDEKPIVVSKKVYVENEKPIIVSLSDYDKYSRGEAIRVSKVDYDKYMDEHAAFIDYDDYDKYLEESRGIVLSKDIYDMYAAGHEEIISIPIDKYVKHDDNVIVLSYNEYKNKKGFNEDEYKIVSEEIFKKYFGNDENLADAIIVSKDVYEKYGKEFKPMRKSPYGDVDEKYLNILESIDKELFKQTKRIN